MRRLASQNAKIRNIEIQLLKFTLFTFEAEKGAKNVRFLQISGTHSECLNCKDATKYLQKNLFRFLTSRKGMAD